MVNVNLNWEVALKFLEIIHYLIIDIGPPFIHFLILNKITCLENFLLRSNDLGKLIHSILPLFFIQSPGRNQIKLFIITIICYA